MYQLADKKKEVTDEADVYMEVKACDERALRVSPSLEESLEEALKKGMKLVYDPNYIVEL